MAPADPNASGVTAVAARRLPPARALIGGALVACAVLGALVVSSAGSDHPAVGVVVAARPLAPGQVLDAADVAVASAGLDPAAASGTVSDPAAVEGARLRCDYQPGEILQVGCLGSAGAGAGHEMAVELSAAQAVGGRLQPGDLVDVVATFGHGEQAWSEVVASAVTVTAAGSADSYASSTTVALTLPDAPTALAVAHAQQAATVSLVRTPGPSAPLGRYRPDAGALG